MHIPRPAHRSLSLLLAALSAAAIAPAAASAAQRFASPNGAGVACTAAAPCGLQVSVVGASNGDEVIVMPGDYPLGASLVDPAKIDIHGVAGQPRPRLIFYGAPEDVRVTHGGTISYVEIIDTSDAIALYLSDSFADGVIAKGVGLGAHTAEVEGGSEVRNSVFVAYGDHGDAVHTETNGGTAVATLRNVTAVATGPNGIAVEVDAEAPTGKATLNLINVIASSAPSSASLKVSTDSSGADATLEPVYSDFQAEIVSGTHAAITSDPSNKGYTPKFVDPSVANYREASGSPTIDRGVDDPLNGPFDLDGGPRIVGTTDIGADEFDPAPPAGGGGGGGSSDPTTDSTPTGDAAAPAPTAAASIAPETTPPAVVPFAGARLVSRRLALSGRFIAIRLSCPAAAKGGCSGRTKLIVRKRRAHSSRNVVLGAARFSIAAGSRTKVLVRVSRAHRRLVRRSLRLIGLAITDSSNPTGQTARSVDDVRIRHRRA